MINQTKVNIQPINQKKIIHSRFNQVYQKIKPSQILVLFSNPSKPSQHLPTNGNFRADSNFYYLTGINHPNLIAVLSQKNYFVFAPHFSKEQYVWDSDLFGIEELSLAKDFYQIDEVFAKDFFVSKVVELCNDEKYDELICEFNQEKIIKPDEIKQVFSNIRKSKKRDDKAPISKFSDSNQFFASIRTIKTIEEIELMAVSAKIAAKAHNHLAKNLKRIDSETELMNLFSSYSSNLGSDGLAYPSIVAAGNNGCILHYRTNNSMIKNTDSVLIDAGCLYQGYCSDITRVFPKSGKFTGAMRDLYQAVYGIQKELIDYLKVAKRFNQIQEKAIYLISQALIDLKLVHQNLDEVIESHRYKDFYMHSFGHFLGLDVHDFASYKDENGKSIELASGMVFTVEPGIYIHPSLNVLDEFKGLAVRIEDDVALNYDETNSCEVKILTEDALKQMDDLENLMMG